ncbi:TetR/AcrR family transcriptional regulator [Pseudonocardia xishanensis]|uniref:HTH tetR-type domain-containing protein n=1 Tax=Pseudonocardia xishanensis TaxID=630995 RepID=A0ABP8RSA0_9PSEU
MPPATRRSVQAPRPRPGRSPVNEQKYAEIVAVAGRLFAEKGFAGTSLTDIAVEVGVLKGSLYHYITSKEDLLAEVVRIGQLGQSENLQLVAHFDGEPLEQLVAFAYGHVRLNATPERLERGNVFLRDGENLQPARREAFIARRDEYERFLRSVVVAGQRAGLLDPEADPRMASFGVLGVVNSFSRWYKPDGSLTAVQIAREFAAFALSAVRLREGDAEGRFDLVDRVVAECERFISQNDLLLDLQNTG